jgi:hypothetical protein
MDDLSTDITDANLRKIIERVGSVSSRQACTLIPCGLTRLRTLIRAGEIESFRDGPSLRITLRSIIARRDRLLANAKENAAA